jgi:hypothetical protein
MLALRAMSHDFAGVPTPSCKAKKDSNPGESKENPVCLDLSPGSCDIAFILRSSGVGLWNIAIISVCCSLSSISST